MPTRILLLTAILAAATGAAMATASAPPSAPDPQAILRAVRLNASMQTDPLAGEIRSDKARFPFQLTMDGKSLSFAFRDPDQIITLHLDDETFRFTEQLGSAPRRPVPPARQSESLRGTDITYEDLALRFLFWKNAKILQEEKFKGRTAWKLRIDNPGSPGPYAVVYAWIDQESAALLRVQGYDGNGRCVKQFEILSGMKVGDAWMLKEMRVETLDGQKPTSRTYLTLDKPSSTAGRRPDW